MRGRWWHRALCVVFGLWLGVYVTEPDWLHACRLHSGDVAGHDHGASHHGAAPDGASSDGAAATCSCPGPCSAPAVTPVPAAVALALPDALVVTASAARPEHEYVAAWVDFVLPYATAPPPLV